jgi:hypothetical protein
MAIDADEILRSLDTAAERLAVSRRTLVSATRVITNKIHILIVVF